LPGKFAFYIVFSNDLFFLHFGEFFVTAPTVIVLTVTEALKSLGNLGAQPQSMLTACWNYSLSHSTEQGPPHLQQPFSSKNRNDLSW
jgi:hypothetical protein